MYGSAGAFYVIYRQYNVQKQTLFCHILITSLHSKRCISEFLLRAVLIHAATVVASICVAAAQHV